MEDKQQNEIVGGMTTGQSMGTGEQTVTPNLTVVSSEQPRVGSKLSRIRLPGGVKLWGAIGIALLLVGLVVLAIVIKGNSDANKRNASISGASDRYAPQTIDLSGVYPSDTVNLSTSQSLSINGQLRTNNSLVLTPTDRPTEGTRGQIYYDKATDTPYIYNGQGFVAISTGGSISGATGEVVLGAGLLLQNGQLSLSPDVISAVSAASAVGVTSLQGLTGSVNLSAGNGIAISGTTITNTGVRSIQAASPQLTVTSAGNGVFSIGATGDLLTGSGTGGSIAVFTGAGALADSLLSQSGGSIVVSGDLQATGQLSANTISSLTPGQDFTLSAGNNQLVLVSEGRTFQLPSTGAVNQTICTVGMDCTTGGGASFVLLQPGTVQEDSGGGASIFVNNTGGGDLLRLQGNSINRLVVANNGDMTLSGDLTVTGAINGATVNNANINGGTITGATINDALITGGSLSNTSVNGLTVTSTSIASSSSLAISTANNQNLSLNTFGTGVISIGSAELQGTGALTVSAGGTDQDLTLSGSGVGNVAIMVPRFIGPNGATYTFDASDPSSVNATICTSVGNCLGSGSGVGGSGTAGTIAVFDGTGFTIGDSLLSQSAGTVTVTGDLAATNLQGNGGSITDINAANVTVGMLSDGRLSNNVALYSSAVANFAGTLQQGGNDVCTTAGNCAGSGAGIGGSGTAGTIAVFNGSGYTLTNSLLSQSGSAVTVAGDLVATNLQGNGSAVTNVNAALLGGQAASYYLDASNISSGTLADGRLSLNVTMQGNTFNGANQLVQLDASGQLPALSGALLTNLNANSITTGTIDDARLSANVALFDTVTANFTGTLQQGGNDVCTTAGNCVGSGGGAVGGSGTAGTIAVFNGSGYTLTDSLLSQSAGVVTIAGDLVATNLQGNGSAITDVNAALLGGQAASYYLNASNISSGTLADARLTSNVTLQGNTFNGANQLIQLNATGQLPAINGSLLTNLNASSIASGTLADGRLSANVALLNAATANFTGTLQQGGNDVCTTAGNCVGSGGGAVGGSGTAGTIAVFNGSGFTIADSLLSQSGGTVSVAGSGILSAAGVDQDLTLQGNGTGSVVIKNPSFNNVNGATYTFSGTDGVGVNATICTSVGNCVGSGGGAIGGGGTAGTLAVFDGTGYSVANSLLSQSGGTVTVAGDLVATNLQGNGSGITDVNAALLNGQTAGYYLNASNINSGTLADNRLSPNVTLQGNTFNGAGQLVQLDASGRLPAVSGEQLTSLNASNLNSGTLADARLTSNVTLQGNTFNGVSQLVQLNASGQLPVLNGSLLTSLNASSIASGTLADGRLSVNVALYSAPTANFTGNLQQGGNDVCTTAGNCIGSGGAIGGGGTVGYLPVFSGSGYTIVDSLIHQSAGVVTVSNSLLAAGDLGVVGAFTATGTATIGSLNSVGVVHTDASGNLSTSLVTNSDLQGGTYSAITGTGALSAGSIAAGFGTISTTNNITTTATLQGANINATSEIRTGGTVRISSSGTISNITNYSQTSGIFAANTTIAAINASSDIQLTAPTTSITGALTVSGTSTLQNVTLNGTQLTNNGSTLNTALALPNFAASGPIGTAVGTVDRYTSIAINQTSAGITLSLPTPTDTTAGRVMYVMNTALFGFGFTMHGVTVNPGYGQIYIWNGTSWVLSATGGGTSISLQGAYDGGNTINTTDARNIAFTLSNTTTDANFITNIASGSSGQFKIQNNGTDILTVGSSGQLGLSVQGAGGGISIGGDTTLYRSGANRAQMSNALTLRNTTDTASAFQVQTASGSDVLAVSTAAGTVTIGASTGSTAKLSVNSESGVTWTARSAAQANMWQAVTFGKGQFVAVAGDGTSRVMTSPDGITWTARTAAGSGTETWMSVVYGNNLYVAVATTGETMTSPDGITWTLRTAPSGSWRSVTYGNGVYVAVSGAGTNRVMTSTDGITWTARTASENNGWRSVVYGNGQFVAVANSGTNRAMTSTDGINWTARFMGTPVSYAVTYGKGLFIAVGSGTVLTSPDGITWTQRTDPGSGSWQGITYGNGVFVAVSNSSSERIMTSSDGIVWTARTAPEMSASWESVAYGNGTFVAVSDDATNRVMTSSAVAALQADGNASISGDVNVGGNIQGSTGVFTGNVAIGIPSSTANAQLQIASQDTWVARSAAELNSWVGVTYGNGTYVAISNGGTNRVMTSPDGITWTPRAATEANTWASVTYGNGLFVAVSSNGTNRVMTSPDGITWTPRTAAEANSWNSVTYGNGLFVAVSSNGTNRVMTSPDGITWTPRAAAAASNWYDVTYGNGLFVAVTTGRAMTSSDGITWTDRIVSGVYMSEVAYGNGMFVSTATLGTDRIVTSPDGITWTARTAPEGNSWQGITYGNGLFVAVSSNGTNRIMTSSNGITWIARTAPEANSWNSVTYGNGIFVAVSSSGTNRVMTHRPGGTTAMLVQDTAGVDVLNVSTASRNVTVSNLTVAAYGALRVTGGDTSTRPTNPAEGTIYFDSTTKQLIYYANGQWKSASQVNSVVTVASPTSKGKDGADFVVSSADEAAGNADTAIAAAVAALPASGGTVYLMEGTYTIDNAIAISNNTTLAGSGRNSTIIKLKSGHNASINMIDVSNGFNYHTNVAIKDLAIDGNKATQTAGTQHGIHTYRTGTQTSASVGVTIENIYVKDMRNNGTYIEQTANSKVSDSYFMTNGGAGIYANTATNRNSYTNNTVRDNTGVGIDVEGDSDIISNNHSQGNGSHGIDANGTSTRVTNNTVTNNGGRGINSTAGNAVLTGNHVSSNTSNGMYIDDKANVTNNQIQSNGASGIFSQYVDIAATISNNIISANTGSGIEFNRGGANTSITGNTIESNTVAGINIYGYMYQLETGLAISNNYVGNNATYGISLSSVAHSSVSSNTLVNNGGATTNYGIRIASSYSGNINITGNSIMDSSCTTTCYAIAIEAGRDNLISNNTLGDATLSDIGGNIYGQGEILDNGTNTNYANQRDGNGNLINRSSGAFGVNTSTVTSSLTLQGGMTNSQLPTPAQPTVALVGTAGTTTYGYRVSALDGTGETLASTERTITNAFATLSGTNYNVVTWAEVPGAVQYRVYRSTSAGTPASTGLIATVTGGATVTFNDTGIAATTAVPAANTTGGATIAGVLQSNSRVLTPSIDSSGPTLEVGKTTGTVSIGTGTNSQIIFLGSNAATKYVSIGSPLTNGFTSIQSGTGGISLNSNGGAISLTGATSVTGDSPSTFKVQDSYGVSILKVDGSLKKVEVRELTVVYNLTVNGHIISGGSVPTLTPGPAACDSAIVNVSGNDTAGKIYIGVTAFANCTVSGQLARITFATPYTNSPNVALTPASAPTSGISTYLDNTNVISTYFDINTTDILVPGQTYIWHYHVIE